MHFFRTLRGKLILTYTLVTVLALLALEVIGALILIGGTYATSVNREEYFSDVVFVLYPQAREYLQPGSENLTGLQAWLDQTYDKGYASMPPQNSFDSPAATIFRGDPMYVLSPKGVVLAQSPSGGNSLTGRAYTPPDFSSSRSVLENALSKSFTTQNLHTVKPDGNYYMAVPVTASSRDSALVGVIILTVKPPPPQLVTVGPFVWPLILSFGPVLAGVLIVTGIILLMVVTPFAALFGMVMSRGLTRRLQALTIAADAWSEGNFVPIPQDRSKDEISQLGMRLRHMAERLQALMQARQELATMEERNRLARELHDTVKQQTFATLMQVRAARNLVASDPDAAEQHLVEAENLVKTSQQELGLLISELRPAALEGHGLSEALRSYLDTWSQQSCIPSNFQVENERQLQLETEQTLFRVTQEGLSNIARHSRASAASVLLRCIPGTSARAGRVQLIIQDNGIGFSSEGSTKPGYGLQSMQERLEALGGTIQIDSQAGSGTCLTASIPLPTVSVKG